MTQLVADNTKVLVVDDDSDFRDLISGYLRDRGFQVIEARDGFEAVRVAGREQPDIVLLDIMMPNRNGYDVCRDLKSDSRTSESTVIMLTVKNTVRDKLAAYTAGAQRFIDKGAGLEDIDSCIKTVVRQRTIRHKQLPEDFY